MEEIICSQCGHSIDDHHEDYDGGGDCLKCRKEREKVNPDYDSSLPFPYCGYRPETIELEHLRKQIEIKELANKELQRRIITLVNDIKTIVNADVNLSATDLRLYAFDCLLKKGYISNNAEPV
jgi:hypothetical protein